MTRRSTLPFNRTEAERRRISVTSEYDLNSLDGWGRIVAAYDAPSESTHAERIFTYGLIVANRPERVLEIGFRFGGSSFLISAALEDAERGRLVSIDPAPESVLDFTRFGDRFTLLRGSSPQAIPQATAILGGAINLCFIDGDHSYHAVLADLEGIDPHMAPNSYVLLHDAEYPDVKRATESFLESRRHRVIDCGLICPWISSEGWSGLRLLRVISGA